MSLYRQCRLRKGQLTRTSWIPEPFGRLGKVLRIRDRGGEWDDGWIVETVGEPQDDPPDFRAWFVTCPELKR